MRIVQPRQFRIEIFAWREGDEFFLSPHATAIRGRRPIQRFDDRHELEKAVRDKGNKLTWLD